MDTENTQERPMEIVVVVEDLQFGDEMLVTMWNRNQSKNVRARIVKIGRLENKPFGLARSAVLLNTETDELFNFDFKWTTAVIDGPKHRAAKANPGLVEWDERSGHYLWMPGVHVRGWMGPRRHRR